VVYKKRNAKTKKTEIIKLKIEVKKLMMLHLGDICNQVMKLCKIVPKF